MRSNKIHNVDLFTQAANDSFQKHVKTQSKQALEIINKKMNWTRLLQPIERAVAKERSGGSSAGRSAMSSSNVSCCNRSITCPTRVWKKRSLIGGVSKSF